MKKGWRPVLSDLVFLDSVIEDRKRGSNKEFFISNYGLLKNDWIKYLNLKGNPSIYGPCLPLWELHKKKLLNLYLHPSGRFEDFYNNFKENNTEGLNICYYCGRPQAQTIDHYLPKDSFPQLCFMPINLVPACFKCNNKKGEKLNSPSLNCFVHPYFLEEDRLIELKLNYAGLTPVFCLEAYSKLPKDLLDDVNFQIKELLLDEALVNSAKVPWNTLVKHFRSKQRVWTLRDIHEYLEDKKEEYFNTYESQNYIFYLVVEAMLNNPQTLNVLFQYSQQSF